MGKKLYPSNVLKEAIRAEIAWKQIDEELAFGSANAAALAADIENIYRAQSDLRSLEKQLIQVRYRRDQFFLSAWDKVKRLRAGVKGLYGDDSTQYELVGGTRRSERKRPRRTKISE
jgi:hypothetical protein